MVETVINDYKFKLALNEKTAAPIKKPRFGGI